MTIEDILKFLDSDEEAYKVANDCHDKDHDIRWCPTCSARQDGINEYRDKLIELINYAKKQKDERTENHRNLKIF